MFYLTTHSTHFIYGYMASDIWLRTILILRKMQGTTESHDHPTLKMVRHHHHDKPRVCRGVLTVSTCCSRSFRLCMTNRSFMSSVLLQPSSLTPWSPASCISTKTSSSSAMFSKLRSSMFLCTQSTPSATATFTTI